MGYFTVMSNTTPVPQGQPPAAPPQMPQGATVPQGLPVPLPPQPMMAPTAFAPTTEAAVKAAAAAPSVPATPHGPDVPAMTPPIGVPGTHGLQDSGVEPVFSPEASPYQAPGDIMVDEPDPGYKVISDQITGNSRIVTIQADNAELAQSHGARTAAWNQRFKGGWTNAGVELLDMIPVDMEGNPLVTRRIGKQQIRYHSRWRLTPSL